MNISYICSFRVFSKNDSMHLYYIVLKIVMQKSLSYLVSPLNKSPSKQAHAFPKAMRFLQSRRLHTEIKYVLPSTLQKKACGIGYGKKMSLAMRRHSPPPGSYELGSCFNDISQMLKAPTFSVGRQGVMFGSYLKQAQRHAKQLPSPNKYDIRLPKNRKGGRIGQRLVTEFQKQKLANPGPGSYKTEGTQMSNNQKYVLSTFKRTTSPRYRQENTIVLRRPSVNSHCYEIAEEKFGRSKVSKFKNVSVASFSLAKRESLVEQGKLMVPGFKYSMFSEFGKLKK